MMWIIMKSYLITLMISIEGMITVMVMVNNVYHTETYDVHHV
jgi:hypothetical protein